MKRVVLVLCLCGLLAVPAMAAGWFAPSAFGFSGSFDYIGHVKGNQTAFVGFFVKRGDGGHRKVISFTVSQVPYTCSDAPSGTTTGWRFTDRMRIRPDRAFEGTGKWVELPMDPVGTVSGKLRRGGVAVGDFKLRGELAGPGTHCRTGLVDWRATKQPPPT